MGRGPLLFGSELKALMAHPEWQGTLATEALEGYLRFGCVGGEASIFQGVAKLPPGSMLTLSVADVQAGAKRIECVPTVVDASRYQVARGDERKPSGSPVIGWIGSPSTQRYVLELKPVLEALHREHGARLVLVGAQPALASQFGEVPVEVVASSVGVNIEIVEDCRCGALANGQAQWHQALSVLLTDPAERHALGCRGRQAVEQHYSLQAQAPRLASILRSATGSV